MKRCFIICSGSSASFFTSAVITGDEKLAGLGMITAFIAVLFMVCNTIKENDENK